MSDSMDSLPPIEEPESEHNSIESLPPIDEPEEEVEDDLPPIEEPESEDDFEDDLPPIDDEDPAEDEAPEEMNPDVEQVKAAVAIPVNEAQITGNEIKHFSEKKTRVKVSLENDYKAPQMAPQMKDKNRDAAYELDDRGGDRTYEREGHGKIIVVENATDTQTRMLHNDYYDQGYTGA
jgi:hypothetical protein